ncbi:hypothetical protein LCGC14_2677960, partial [marine sediment metagenome]
MVFYKQFHTVKRTGLVAWHYIISQLSVRTVAILLILVMVFNGIMIPLQFGLLKPFEPETAYAATTITSFTYKKDVTFDTTAAGANVSSSQSSFPVAVHINTSSWPTQSERDNFFDNAGSAGKRVQFFDSDETTNLDYEVEYFDNTQGSEEAIYWVRVPTVSGNSSTDKIVVAYGNDPNGSDQANPTGVWDSSYEMVQHLGDNSWGSSPEAKDSAPNANNGTNAGSLNADGKVRRGRSFVTDDYINTDTVVSEVGTNTAGTFSAWLYPSSATQGSIITFGDTDARNWIYFIIQSSGILTATLMQGGTYQWATDTDTGIGLNAWHHVVLVQDGTSSEIYVDGAQPAQAFFISTDKTKWFSAVSGIDNGRIGSLNKNSAGNARFLDGTVDEVRISSTNR